MKNKVDTEKVIFAELSYKITGLLFEVHNRMGSFAREKQYADLLEQFLRSAQLEFKREIRIADTGNITDFVVDSKIVIELKAVRQITRRDYWQIQNYLQQTRYRLGLLVNFRDPHLKPLRIIRIDSPPAPNSYYS